MGKGESYTESEWAALTPEQQTDVLRIEKAVDKFLADPRAIRYVESDGNQNALLDFLEAHKLKVSHANSVFAYGSLCADGALEFPLAPVTSIPSPPIFPVPTAPEQVEKSKRPIALRNGKQIILEPARPL